MQKSEKVQLSPHFNKNEFACPCCGACKIEWDFLAVLERVRCDLDSPIFINSGYRCKNHNRKVGGSQTSYHLRGMAADIRCTPDLMPKLGQLCEITFPGLIQYQTHWHVDIRPKKYHKLLPA